MRKGVDSVIDILVRYSLLIVFGILNTWVFYLLFTLVTVYPVFLFLKLFFNVIISSSSLLLINGNIPINIIGPCIAGSAYYLLLILNLSTPAIKLGKRIGALAFSFASLLLINIIRIFILSVMFVSGTSFFDMAHKLFWYAGSIIFVVLIWFLTVKIFRIKEIPFYSDIIFLLEHSKKNSRRNTQSKRHSRRR